MQVDKNEKHANGHVKTGTEAEDMYQLLKSEYRTAKKLHQTKKLQESDNATESVKDSKP